MADKTVSYRLSVDIGQFQARMAQASASVRKFAGDATANTKEAGKFRKGLDEIGSSAGRLGLVAAAGLGAAIAVAANFDQAMSNVQAATHESAANMEALRKAAIKAGADTAFSASEAAAGIENLAKAGVSTRDILGGGLNGALDLAAAGSLSVGEAAETAATAMTQFGLSGQQVPHVADLLAAAAGKAQGEVSDFGQALKQSGLIADQTGLSIEETTGALAAFASAGLLGSDAGTSFKTMLQRLSAPMGAAKKEMANLGINAYDAQGSFIGLAAFAQQLQDKLGGMTDAQRNAALSTIFGSDAVRAATVLYEQGGKGIDGWVNSVNDSGYAAETAATKLDNLKGDLEAFKGSLETALIGAGEGSQGPLRKLVQGATDVVNAFNKLPGAAQNVATGMLAITAVTGGSLWFGSRVVRGISDTREALDNLGSTAPKVSGALRRLGAVAVTIGAIETLTAVVNGLEDSMAESAPAVESFVSRLLDLREGSASSLGSQYRDLGQGIDTLSASSERAANAINKFLPDFQGLIPGVESGREAFKAYSDEVDNLDAALAQIATTGSVSAAKEAFAALAEAENLSSDQQKKLIDLLPQYAAALKGTENDARLASSATGDYGSAMADAAKQTVILTDAQKKARAKVAEIAHEFTAFGDSLNDNKVSLSSWIKEMADSAAALRDFTANAQRAAKRGLRDGLIAELNAAGPAGALRMRQLANATDSEIGRANRAWDAGQRAVKHYTDTVAGVPTSKTTRITAETSGALAGVMSVKRALDGLYNKTIHVNVVKTTNANLADQSANSGHAMGGYIRGPGSATSDSIHARLSNGEYVIRAAAVSRYGVDFFNQLNGMRFADGGYVSRTSASTAPTPRQIRSETSGDVIARLSDAQINRLAERIGDRVYSGSQAGIEARDRAAYAGRRTR